ncbi:MAG: CCA tRNA nucleotidyltransferase [Cyclobacteriaceae bacterium]|nr:CCA tRNA nucleotidyltransferase [Cyclobacteriaceae bacterium]
MELDIKTVDRVLRYSSIDIVTQAASNLNVEVYIVGGYVRDLFLERKCKDIDFVCLGSGIALANEVGKLLGTKPVVFKNFGTASLRYKEFELEFVGARKESYRKDSRNPIVEDGTLEEDQKRRDFTINSLAISLNKGSRGELIDPFGGVQHLKEKMIKTPLDPGITFSEDPLRMMRAIRFASQLNFDIDAETFDAISEYKGRIGIVSQERITDELNKIILSPVPSYGFKLLFYSGLLPLIFPEMQALHGVDKIDGKTHKDNFFHTLQVLDNIAEVTDDLWLRWAAILHDIAKPATKRFLKGHGFTFHGHEDKGARMVPGIFRKMKLPLGHQMNFVAKLVRLHLRPIALVKEDITDSALRRVLFEAGDDIDSLMKLCKADITSKNDQKVKKYLRNFELVEQKLIEVEEKDSVRNFQPPLSGEEIMEYFNLMPSKVVGVIKEEIKESIIEGRINNNKEEAWQLMIDMGAKLGLKKEA